MPQKTNTLEDFWKKVVKTASDAHLLNDDCLHEGCECDDGCECECDDCNKQEHSYCPECKTLDGCSCDEQYQAYKERNL